MDRVLQPMNHNLLQTPAAAAAYPTPDPLRHHSTSADTLHSDDAVEDGVEMKRKTLGKKPGGNVDLELSQGFAEMCIDFEPRMYGVALLPLELLVNVAGFLAGQNSYGTLANLATTCKLLKAELAPTLYETVILDSNRQWWQDSEEGLTVKRIFEDTTLQQRIDFRYTRYIIAEKSTVALATFFPKSVVFIHKSRMSFNDYIVFGSHRDAPCCLHLYKPVSVSVLAQLLAIPLHWRETSILQHITGIERLLLSHKGGIVGATSGERLLPLGNASANLEISVLPAIGPTSGFANTVQQIARVVHPPSEASYTKWKKPMRFSAPRGGNFVHELNVFLGSKEVAMLECCLAGMTETLTLDTRFFLTITCGNCSPSVGNSDAVPADEAEVEALLEASAEFFRRLWPVFRHKRGIRIIGWRPRCFFQLKIRRDPYWWSPSCVEGVLYADERERNCFWMAKDRILANGRRQEIGQPRKYIVPSKKSKSAPRQP